jgi:peroxiredoxin
MKFTRSFLTVVSAGFFAGSLVAGAQSLAGRWDAAVNLNGNVIPFRLDVSEDGHTLKGTLFNGEQLETTTSAALENGSAVLRFDHYLTTIRAVPKDGKLEGTLEGRFEAEKYLSSYPFEAKRYAAASPSAVSAPSIAGSWLIPYESAKGEKSWRFIVEQKGADVTASILRVDGDTGALTGSYHDGKFVLSHFDGSRPLVASVTPSKDGTLEILLNGGYVPKDKLTAYRTEVAQEKGIAQPADYTKHTTVRDANERFSFKFPDVNGKLVSSDDPRFQNKVVLAIVTGTWCPNCHDEAQYLVQLYKKYHARGLEIVALDFEEPEQQESLAREKAFVKQYGVDYTYLIAGAPAEMWEKVPQAVNLNTWPATFFIGRDGRVKNIHAGYAAPASGEFHKQLEAEFTGNIERLLSENPKSPTVASVAGSGN